MTGKPGNDTTGATEAGAASGDRPAHDLTDALTELVSALDRRVPRVERPGERQIAIDASELRAEAVERLASLRRDAERPSDPEA